MADDTTTKLAIWEFEPDVDDKLATAVGMDLVEEPDAHGLLVSDYGDVIGLQLVDGQLTGDPESKFYVERRGTFAHLRREEWPPAEPGGRARAVVTLRAWPHRDYDR